MDKIHLGKEHDIPPSLDRSRYTLTYCGYWYADEIYIHSGYRNPSRGSLFIADREWEVTCINCIKKRWKGESKERVKKEQARRAIEEVMES